MEFLVFAQIVFYCAGAISAFILKNDGVINRWTHVSAIAGGADRVVPVDVYVPGCPPRPEAILHGIFLALNKVKSS